MLLGTMSSKTKLDPETIEEALARPEADEWRKAIDDKLKQHQDSGTFRLEHLPPGRRMIGWRMVFQTKQDENGNVSKRKAQLIAQGFTQRFGTEYTETFSPVVRIETLRVLIALATQFDWELDQMDVVGAYLNATLPDDEVLYMDPIPGFHDSSSKVHRVVKSLYRLKQAGHIWNTALNNFLMMRGYQ